MVSLLGLALGSVWFNWFVLVLSTIMWRYLLNQRSYGWKIAIFKCKFPSVRTENSVYMRINFRPYGRKIANSYT